MSKKNLFPGPRYGTMGDAVSTGRFKVAYPFARRDD